MTFLFNWEQKGPNYEHSHENSWVEITPPRA